MQQTLKQIFIKTRRWIFFLSIAAAMALWLPYWLAPEFRGTYDSPHGVYRVEYYTASPLQSLLNYKMKIPSFTRLYRVNPEELMAESEIVDMWLNGELYWYLQPPTNAIQIGRDIAFENTPPECIDCPTLNEREIKS